jgi:hypothetical protein
MLSFYFRPSLDVPKTLEINHSHPIRPARDSQSLGLKRLGFGQRLNVKIQKS